MITSSSLRSVFLVALALAASTGCAPVDSSTDGDTSGQAVTEPAEAPEPAALEPTESTPALISALGGSIKESAITLRAETFTFDVERMTHEEVLAALQADLPHAELRKDQGEMDAAVLDATLEEYGVAVDYPEQREGIADAIGGAVGDGATTKKLWLTSDHIDDAESEWAEVVGFFVSKDTGTAIRLTIHYDN